MWIDETLVALEVVYHLCLDLCFVFGYFIGVLLQHFVFVHCSIYVHVVVLYVDTRCCDDIHEVTPARFRPGGV